MQSSKIIFKSYPLNLLLHRIGLIAPLKNSSISLQISMTSGEVFVLIPAQAIPFPSAPSRPKPVTWASVTTKKQNFITTSTILYKRFSKCSLDRILTFDCNRGARTEPTLRCVVYFSCGLTTKAPEHIVFLAVPYVVEESRRINTLKQNSFL